MFLKGLQLSFFGFQAINLIASWMYYYLRYYVVVTKRIYHELALTI